MVDIGPLPTGKPDTDWDKDASSDSVKESKEEV